MKNDAFTLVEILIAIILIGLAVVALVGANKAFTQSNSAGLELTTAEFLIEQIKELTAVLPVVDPQSGTFGSEEVSLADYDDVDDFDDASFRPPISAERLPLNSFLTYRQQVAVQKVSSSNFSQVVPDTNDSPFINVTVQIYHNSKLVSSESWIRARLEVK